MNVSGLNHLALMSRDLEATVRFYVEVIGLPLVKAYRTGDVPLWEHNGNVLHDGGNLVAPRHYFLDLGDGSLLAFFDPGEGATLPEDFVTVPGAFHHLSLNVADEDALMTARAELKAMGVPVSGVVDHEFCKSIYLRDPDGRNLELSCFTRRVGGADDLHDPDPLPIMNEQLAKLTGQSG